MPTDTTDIVKKKFFKTPKLLKKLRNFEEQQILSSILASLHLPNQHRSVATSNHFSILVNLIKRRHFQHLLLFNCAVCVDRTAVQCTDRI